MVGSRWFFAIVKNFFSVRDGLSFHNIKKELRLVWLLFPLTVIMGDFRIFNLNIAAAGFQSWEIMLYFLGLGWLVLAFIPQNRILPLLRIAAVCSVVLIPIQLVFQLALTGNNALLALFMAFQFFNGICAACAFFLFCFKLNNVERLLGMSMIMFYYGYYYTIYREFSAVQSFIKTWGALIIAAVYLIAVFSFTGKKNKELFKPDNGNIKKDSKGSGVYLALGLHIAYYSVMCMINYIEFAENAVYSLPYGLGQFASIILIFVFMLIINKNAIHIWLMYLVFSLLGMVILIYDSRITEFFGFLVYGLGSGLGYIIIYYLCAKAVKRSESHKMFKLSCIVLFAEYFIISGLLSRAFDNFNESNHLLALGIVLAVCSACFLSFPYLQKRLFEQDWTDGIHLNDLPEYSHSLSETEAVNAKDRHNLTEREHEIFTLLLKGVSPKEIAYTLKVSYHTVDFHRTKLYRKLGIRSIHELYAKYSGNESQKNKKNPKTRQLRREKTAENSKFRQ